MSWASGFAHEVPGGDHNSLERFGEWSYFSVESSSRTDLGLGFTRSSCTQIFSGIFHSHDWIIDKLTTTDASRFLNLTLTDRSIGRIWCCLLDCVWILSRAGAGLLTILLQGFHLCWGSNTFKSWKICESCQASQSSKPRKLHNSVIYRRHQEAIHTNLLCITVHVYKILHYTTCVIHSICKLDMMFLQRLDK